MRMKHILKIFCVTISIALMAGCSAPQQNSEPDPLKALNTSTPEATQATPSETPSASPEATKPEATTVLYQGHASLRITTVEGKVIYVDPYAGEGYDLPADLTLSTHMHDDHTKFDLIKNKTPEWKLISRTEALANGEHQTFDLGYVKIEAVEAGYNPNHDVKKCVGYILTFTDGKTLYISGDTSTTEQMPSLAERNLDYAFFCTDGQYNMDVKEASEAAKLVAAKHNIPYHTYVGKLFSPEIAEQFDVENRIIVKPGEELLLR